MIAIKVGTTTLALFEDTRLSFEFINSAFDFEIIPGSLAWNFDIPGPENSKTLEFTHFIEIKNKARSYDASVNIGAAKEIQGKLVIIRPGTEKYNCLFVVNGFSVDALEQNMKDIDFGADEILGSTTSQVITYVNTKVTQAYPVANFNFPMIKNTVFYGSSNDDWSGICNAWDGLHNTFLPNSISEADSTLNNYNLLPQLHLLFILKKIFSTFGYSVSGEIFNNSEIKKILCYSNHALDLKEQKYRAFIGLPAQTIFQDGLGVDTVLLEFSDEITGDYEDPQSAFNTTTHEYDTTQHGYIKVIANLNFTGVPVCFDDCAMQIMLCVDGVVVETLAYMNGSGDFSDTFTFGSTYKAPLEKMTLRIRNLNITLASEVGGSFDVDGDVEFRNLSYEDLNVFAKSLHYADHVPDTTVKEWLRGWRTTINMRFDFDFDQKKVSIDFAKSILTAKSEDWTPYAAKHHETETNEGDGYTLAFNIDDDTLADENFADLTSFNDVGEVNSVADLPLPNAVNDLILVLNENTYWAVRLDSNNENEWYRVSDNYYPYKIGNGKTEIQHGFAPLLMRTETLLGMEGIFPNILHNGSTTAFDVGLNDHPLRFLIWHGLEYDGAGLVYPLASSQNRNFDGDEVGDLFFRYTTTGNSFYNLYWKDWINFLLSTESNFRLFNLNVNDIFSALFSKKKTVQHVESVVKKLTVDFSSKGIEAAEAELCKIL